MTATAQATQGDAYMNDTLSLGDIPDLSSLDTSAETTEWADGWYQGTVLEQRSFTDRNGNDRVFESSDQPSQAGDSRNIKLQVVIKRQDGKTLNVSTLINYRPEDLSQSVVEAVVADRAKPQGEQDGSLTRAFLTLQRLGKLQKIAGVRQFQRNGNGGLDLHTCFNKDGFFRLGPDTRSEGKYKEVKDMRADKPTRAAVL